MVVNYLQVIQFAIWCEVVVVVIVIIIIVCCVFPKNELLLLLIIMIAAFKTYLCEIVIFKRFMVHGQFLLLWQQMRRCYSLLINSFFPTFTYNKGVRCEILPKIIQDPYFDLCCVPFCSFVVHAFPSLCFWELLTDVGFIFADNWVGESSVVSYLSCLFCFCFCFVGTKIICLPRYDTSTTKIHHQWTWEDKRLHDEKN